MEETYYKKILVSSGEVPEEEDHYTTSEGLRWFHPSKGFICLEGINVIKVVWYLKPVPSPKQEAVEFVVWACSRYLFCHLNNEPMFKEAGTFNYFTPQKAYEIYTETNKMAVPENKDSK